MDKVNVCAVIRELNEPNKFNEYFRIDFHHFEQEQIGKIMYSYEIDTKEHALAMLKGDSWVRDSYSVKSILELKENEKLPNQEITPILFIKPSYITYELSLEDFENYLNNWFKMERNFDLTLKVYGGNGGGYGYFGFTIDESYQQNLLCEFYQVENNQDFEYEIVHHIMKDVFQENKIQFYFDTDREKLIVHLPYA